MANKFTKSVLEREAKEMKRVAKAPLPPEQPLGKTPQVVSEPVEGSQSPETASLAPEQPTESTSTIEAVIQVVMPPATTLEASGSGVEDVANLPAPLPGRPAGKRSPRPVSLGEGLPDLGSFIIREEGRCAKNKTFYLDATVIEGLRRAATAQKVTESKLVNDILKRLLGV